MSLGVHKSILHILVLGGGRQENVTSSVTFKTTVNQDIRVPRINEQDIRVPRINDQDSRVPRLGDQDNRIPRVLDPWRHNPDPLRLEKNTNIVFIITVLNVVKFNDVLD